MNRLAVMPRTLLMALSGVAGIVGMLLSEGWGDVPCFLLAALPLAVGIGAHARRRWDGTPSRAAARHVSR